MTDWAAWPPDVNGDGAVGLSDLGAITFRWAQQYDNTDPRSFEDLDPNESTDADLRALRRMDANGNGTIALGDIGVVVSHWGNTPPGYIIAKNIGWNHWNPPVPNGDCEEWMTFDTDVWLDYADSQWSGVISEAETNWNDLGTTVRFRAQSSRDAGNEIHVVVTSEPEFPITLRDYSTGDDVHFTFKWTGDIAHASGVGEMFNAEGEECDDGMFGACPPTGDHTIRQALVVMKDGDFNVTYGHDRALAGITHELGHAIGLAHDKGDADPERSDGICPGYVIPETIMDYECMAGVNPNGPQVKTPQQWDRCGINLMYYDSTYGFGGCG